MDKMKLLKKRLIEIAKKNMIFPDDIDAYTLADDMLESL